MASTDNKHNRVIIDVQKNVNDEFYTPYDIIERELSHHVSYFYRTITMVRWVCR